ncbi:unnamed protein product [Durusdinium trenchii]|uniref:Peptidase S1 domain-containing protein n=1 Tax=Durusdinium trenchii TaxID=1381693 RepID=A0ABP0JBF1_9DINO
MPLCCLPAVITMAMAMGAAAFTSPPVFARPRLQEVLHTNTSCPPGFKACGHCGCAPADACDACKGPLGEVNVTVRAVRSKMAGCPSDHVDCGNQTCVPQSKCAATGSPQAVPSSSRRSILQDCPAVYTDCGVCQCVPGDVCQRCPNVIALSIPAENGTDFDMSSEPTANNSEPQENGQPPHYPSEERIWAVDGLAKSVSWARYQSTYPFLVAIKWIGRGGKRSHMCGGTLIRESVVLTAAHCVSQMRNGRIMFLDASIVEVWWGQGDNNWISSGVDLLVIPSSYNGNDGNDDIAILHLTRRFSGASVARLSRRKWYNVGSKPLIAGWGAVDRHSQWYQADKLREGYTQIADSALCKAMIKDFDPAKKICAGSYRSGLAGTAKGDSGGPMLLNGYQIGITSHGFRVGNEYLDVYTRVSNYGGWINQVFAHYR